MRNLRELGGYSGDANPGMSGAPAPAMRPMPPLQSENQFFRFDLLRALEMHRRLVAGILALAVLATLGYLVMRWNTYKSQALVYVQPAPSKVMESGPEQHWPYDANTYESYIQQQMHDITRFDVLVGAVSRMPGWKGANERNQAAADRLNGAVEVARDGPGYQISITATGSSAEEAATMANAVASSYIESTTRELRSGDTERIELLREERDRITRELASDRAEQEDLNKKLGVAGVGAATPDPYDDQIAAIRGELVKARTASDEAAARLTAEAGGGVSSAALDAEAEQLVAGDPGLVSMKTELNKRRSLLISQMSNLTPSHPQYKQDADELAKINSSLDQMSKDLRAKASAELEQRLKNDLERTEGVEAKLNSQLGQLSGAAGSATPRLQRANDLAADINRLQARFTVVDEQYRNQTMENNAPGAVYLSASALPPLHAARNKVFRNGLIVLLTGLILALGAALIAHNMDPRIYIAADVERVLGFAPMALLPDLHEVGASIAEEYMLRLAAAVEHAHQQGALNSCIFTGVAAGAGATTASMRVSSMLEEMGRETVFVDAVGAPPPRYDSALNPGTDIVHSPRGTRSTALLQQMTQEASDESVVVADTAPLLVSGETEYLARFVDATIVVVESGVTTRAQLREVARTLERLDVSAVGFVLNRISLAKADPSFRHSVHAVETRLRAQALVFERPEPPERHEPTSAKSETAPEKSSEPLYASSGLGPLWKLPEETEHAPFSTAPRSLIPEPGTHEPAAELPSLSRMEAAHPAHIPWDHPSIQPGTAKPEFKEPEAGEPAYLHYLHPAPSAAVEAAAPHAVVATGRTIEEPFFIARAAAAAPARAAAPAPREETTAPPEVPTIGPEAPTWPEPAAHAPEPPDHPDVPDYILKAPAPVVPELPFRLRPAWEPEPPKVEPARHEPPVVDQQRYEFLQTEHVQPEPVKFEPVLPKPVKPEPVLPQAVAAAPVPMPESRPDSLPDPLMETPQPSAARTPLAEIRSTVAPFVAYPMRGREPVRPFAVEFRPAAPPPAEAAPVPEPEFRSAPEAAPAPRRDYSVSVMPPLPAARKREPLPRPDSDPRAGTHQDPQVLFDAPQTDAHPVEETRPAAAAHPVEETRPAAARLVVDKIPVEEQTHFPFPQRPPEPRVAPAPELPARAYEPARPDPSQVEELMSSSVGPEVDAENLPYSAASRLGGLRNLMVSLGLKNLQREAEFRSAGIESDSERIPERAVYAQPANAPEGAPEPESVVARPEIIPPRIGPEAAERAKGPIRSVKSPRVKSWESTDDVETLPSRRGQYRRR